MSLFGLDLNLSYVWVAAGVLLGWHFPQPVWVGATWEALKTWFANLKK